MKTFKKEQKLKRSQNKENIQPQSSLLRLCPDCFQPISERCRHPCGAQAELHNISNLLGPDKMEELCHSFMKEKAGSSGDQLFSLQGRFGGMPMKVVVNPEPVKPKKVFGLRETIALRTEGNFTSKYDLLF